MSGKIRCGWAVADITPKGKMPLMGQFHERIPEYTRDPLQATVLAMQSDSGSCVFWVSLDLGEIQRAQIESLSGRLEAAIPGFSRDQLIVNATHIHTGPYPSRTIISQAWGQAYELITPQGCLTPEEYMEGTFLPKVETACVDAMNNLAESRVSFQLGHATLGHNRRVTYTDGSAVMYGTTNTVNFNALEGPSDSGVELMYVFDKDGEITGVVVNVACPSQVLENQCYYTADFWGDLRPLLSEHFNRQVYVLAQCSAAGDQSPRDMVRRSRAEPDMNSPDGSVELARRLFMTIVDRYKPAAQCKSDQAQLIHKVIPMDLPIRRVSALELAKARSELSAIMAKYPDESSMSLEDRMMSTFPWGVIMRAEKQEKSIFYHYDLHVIRVGEAVFVTNPFELFINYGFQIKARSRAYQTLIVQLCGDDGGYLPTSEAIKGGSYSSMISNGTVGPDAGDILVNTTVESINQMF